MMTVAFAAFHGVRSLARERLGVSCGLRGNGMGFSSAVLRAHPHRAFSIVEDVEYGIQLGYAGVQVHYVDEAHVFGQMVVGEQASRSQRITLGASPPELPWVRGFL
jgi:cellulose synthase/poly-beta-1,6-N-acetylglucosamine synthase-like glycosyltransferase